MPAARRGFLRVGAGRIEYISFTLGAQSTKAARNRPTLVFLHEGLGCCEQWRDFPAVVAAGTGHDAFVYSRPGYGSSDRVSPMVSTRYMHDEALQTLPQVLRAARVNEHILIGHSDGASIAIIYAGGSDAPGLHGLVLIAPHVFVEPFTLTSISAARETFEKGDLKARIQRWHGENTDFAFYRWSGSWLDPEFRHWNIEEYLPRVKVPTLVIQGEQDEYATKAQVEAVERKVGGPVRAVLLANCGHHPQRDQPQATVDEITAFVKSLEGAGKPA
jgi:pimeloyl-ACP methyl ester carboxylesterase